MATSVKCIRKQWHSENGPELSTVQACIPEKGSLPSITFRHLCAKCSAFSVEQWSPFHTVVLGLLKALIYCLQLKPLITKSDKGTPEVTVNLCHLVMQQTTGLQVVSASTKPFQVYEGSSSERLCEVPFVFVEFCVWEMLSREAGIGNPELLLWPGSKKVAFSVVLTHITRSLSKVSEFHHQFA